MEEQKKSKKAIEEVVKQTREELMEYVKEQRRVSALPAQQLLQQARVPSEKKLPLRGLVQLRGGIINVHITCLDLFIQFILCCPVILKHTVNMLLMIRNEAEERILHISTKSIILFLLSWICCLWEGTEKLPCGQSWDSVYCACS